MEQAIFISRSRAENFADTLYQRNRSIVATDVRPYYKRGEVKGFTVYYTERGFSSAPVTEEML